jgi:hypothetical protein
LQTIISRFHFKIKNQSGPKEPEGSHQNILNLKEARLPDYLHGKVIMKKLPCIFLLGFLSIVAFGCVSARTYQVQVNGYTDSAGPVLAPGAPLFVMEDQKAQNPPLEKEIKDKIDNLLVKHGYLLAPYDKAQFYLFFTYGLGTPQTITITGPIGPGFGWEEFGYSAYLPAAYGPYGTKKLTLNDRWLRLTVVAGKYYRETGKSRPVWVGEARSMGSSSDLREVIGPLLIAAFEQFGKDTGKEVLIRVKENDPLVRELKSVR